MIMDYEKKYKNALERARGLLDGMEEGGYFATLEDIKQIFPELVYEEITIPDGFKATIEDKKIIIKRKNSEDEDVRQAIINFFKSERKKNGIAVLHFGVNIEKMIDWLEKQGEMKQQVNSVKEIWKGMRFEVYAQASGNKHENNDSDNTTKMFSLNDIDEIIEKISEQKSDNKVEQKSISDFNANNWYVSKVDGKIHNIYNSKVEPKFHEGDWVVQGYNILKIKCVGDTYYCFETVGGYADDMLVSEIDSQFHLWTIQDAKDGDILSNGDMILIFKKFEIPAYKQHIIAYIGLDNCGNIQVTDEHWTLGIDKAKPATKEQRDILFTKMREAGYIFDFDKKELKKIEKQPSKLKWTVEDNNVNDEINAPTEYGKYVDECLNAASKHFFSEGEDKYSVADLFYAGVRCGKSWLEKQVPKPKWSEEDDYNVQCCIAKAERDITNGYPGRNKELIEWLKSIKQRIEEQQ